MHKKAADYIKILSACRLQDGLMEAGATRWKSPATPWELHLTISWNARQKESGNSWSPCTILDSQSTSSYCLLTQCPPPGQKEGIAWEVLPNKMRGKACQISISLNTMKGVKIPPRSHRAEHTIIPRFLGRHRDATGHVHVSSSRCSQHPRASTRLGVHRAGEELCGKKVTGEHRGRYGLTTAPAAEKTAYVCNCTLICLALTLLKAS